MSKLLNDIDIIDGHIHIHRWYDENKKESFIHGIED